MADRKMIYLDDAIEAVVKESQMEGAYGYMDTKSIVDLLRDLPSAQPERKTGRWMFEERKRLIDETDDGPVYRTEKWWSCSECGYAKGYRISKPSSNYCENCGSPILKEGEG